MFSKDSCAWSTVKPSQSNSWDFIVITRTIPGQGDLWLLKAFRPIPCHLLKKTAMFSRLSASKAALKSVGTAARTPSPSSSTVRVRAKLRPLSNPLTPHISLGPVPLVQHQSRSCSGHCLVLLFLPFDLLKLVSSAIPRLSYRLGLRQHTYCWFDCLVHSSLWVASIRRRSSCKLSR